MFADGAKRAAGHRLIFENSPENWQNGFPVGNGMFGGLVYQPDEAVVEFAFTRLNLWRKHLVPWKRMDLAAIRKICREAPESLEELLNQEHDTQPGPSFKPGGRLRIWLDQFGGTPNSSVFDRRQELDLEHGEVIGSYELSGKAMERVTVAAPDCDVIATYVRDTYLHPAQVNTYLSYTQRIELYRLYDPDAEINELGVTDEGIAYIIFGFHEELRSIIAFKVSGVPWHTPVSLGASVSIELDLDYIHAKGPLSYTVYQTMLVSEDGTEHLLDRAKELLKQAEARGFDKMRADNAAFWRNFWQVSGIAIANPALEALFYHTLYQYGVQSRGDVAPALFGLWNAEKSAPWSGEYAGDVNMSMYCWPLGPLNHPEMLEGVFRTIERWLPAIRRETIRDYGVDALRFPIGCGPLGEEITPMVYHLMICASGFYMDFFRKAAAFYPDETMLRERIFPVMLGAARFYVAMVDEERNKDGKLHFGPSWAPEQGIVPAYNVSNDLGLIKPLWQTVVSMAKQLGMQDENVSQIERLLRDFPEYPQADGEFIDSASEKGRTELCHPGYLACVVPGDDVDADAPLAQVADKTLRQHLDHTCRKPLAGKIGSGCDLTWGWMLAAAVRLRDADFANEILRNIGLADFVKSNGMFAYIGGRVLGGIEEKRRAFDVKGAQPHSLLSQSACLRGRDCSMTMVQSGGGFLYGMLESMLQSHRTQIKLFPCVMDICGEALSFHDLRAEGGLTVSAAWRKGRVLWFEVTCGQLPYNGTLRWFDQPDVEVLELHSGKLLPRVSKGCFSLALAPGEKIQWGDNVSQCAVPAHTPGIKGYADDIVVQYGRRGTWY